MSELKRFSKQFLLRQVSRMARLAKYPYVSESMTLETVEAIVDETLRVLDEACVSEEHVEKTIDEWVYDQEFFPTPAELRRKAWEHRSRYDPGFTAEEPKYPPAGPPVEMPEELRELWAKACANVDAQTEMWAAIKRELRVVNFAQVSWLQIAHAKQKLGYPLNEGDRRALEPARERPASWDQRPNGEPIPPLPEKRITAIDFDQARREYEKKKFGDKS